ncbi:YrrS family protein [Neobacillus sp. NPDC058068]|uniref:YrrS family protein n=1 Tax=Neobacillus sp. NPDC058068 TaxID=3346325 RepID=UPI0036DF2776
MSNDFNSNSRSGYRAKRKKTNIVLNGLIIVVLLLIIFVAYNIFASGNDKAAPKKESPKTAQNDTEHKEVKDKKKDEDVKKEEDTKKDDSSSDDTTAGDQPSEETTTPEKPDDSQAVVSGGGTSSNVLKTIENPSWKPVGTSQTGNHTPVYSGTDWEEMKNAISYATGLDPSNMTVFWLGSDKSTTNASIGTVHSKDKTQKYKVYIKWVDGQGWMPTKVEELAELQR